MNTEKKDSFIVYFIKYILPPFLVFGAVVVAVVMVKAKPKPEEVELEKIVPNVRVITVNKEDVSLDVVSQGNVVPRIETQLISEVSGQVTWVSPALYAGGFFKKGDLLIQIEDSEYQAAVANAESVLAQMKLLYEQELALSAQAKKDWEDMGKGEATDLVLRKPQLEKAKADVRFAEATLKVAKRNLGYTKVKAPYDGRVRKKFVDVGQSVSPKATQLAVIYSVDSAEIRLSIQAPDTVFIDLPELYVEGETDGEKPSVEIWSENGDARVKWDGVIDRTEGAVDATTRLVYVVAKVDDPYSRAKHAEQPPLKVGMFVKAVIKGKVLKDAFVLPSGALKPGNLVYTINDANRLEIREVTVVKRDLDTVVISEGLNDGDIVVMTALQAVVDGMELEPIHGDS